MRLKSLANAVGDFIRYWGFRRVHGQLWTQIYLSKKPLSGSELVKGLGVSKALVSPALNELARFNLIRSVKADGRTNKYSANPNTFEVIREVLRRRELKLIETAQDRHQQLRQSVDRVEVADALIDGDRLDRLGELISGAQLAVSSMVDVAGLDFFDNILALSSAKER